MGTNQKLSTLRQEATRQLILETGFQLFSENTIEAITMADVANAAGVGVATVYRYFNTKQTLVLAINTWIWEKNIQEAIRSGGIRNATAAEIFEYYLDVFLSLYHNHRNVLRFNQFFNVYFGKEGVGSAGRTLLPGGLRSCSAARRRITVCVPTFRQRRSCLRRFI